MVDHAHSLVTETLDLRASSSNPKPNLSPYLGLTFPEVSAACFVACQSVVRSSCQTVPVAPYTLSLGEHSSHACHQDFALITIYLLYNTKPYRVAKTIRLKFTSKPASSPQGQVESHSLNVVSRDIL